MEASSNENDSPWLQIGERDAHDLHQFAAIRMAGRRCEVALN
jgi:hypothetical protein